MATDKGGLPGHYQSIKQRYPEISDALSNLGSAVRKAGPLNDKTGHLIQLAAAAAIRSEGAVHSHTRQAVDAGATAEEIQHAVLILTSTIGFPAVSAALSWVDEVLEHSHKKDNAS
ncbi:carboxymuconolactone decarboxylase family protein [Psychromonas sp.]|uniref:carboxymuconolactone decarboxylase family protein n=1 Tax=Psychromonas sp. TaxID=1884585 RepID=UPI00356AC4D8